MVLLLLDYFTAIGVDHFPVSVLPKACISSLKAQ